MLLVDNHTPVPACRGKVSFWGQQLCWLNAPALRNRHDMLVTLVVIQFPIAPLNDVAPRGATFLGWQCLVRLDPFRTESLVKHS
jgi:hypothetical protein